MVSAASNLDWLVFAIAGVIFVSGLFLLFQGMSGSGK